MVVPPPPKEAGVTTPLVETIVATPELPPLQVPPATASVKVTAAPPTHNDVVPTMAVGTALTVTVTVALQFPKESTITAVPAVSPVTSPDPSTIATVEL